MNNKKFWSQWFFPLMSIVMFVTLLIAMLIEMPSIDVKMLSSFSSGLLAYTMMLAVTFIASRPKYFMERFGMGSMFEVHGVMSIVLAMLVLLHIGFQWTGFKGISEMSVVTQVGWIGTVSLIVVMLTGIFGLTTQFVKNNKALKGVYDKMNRNIMLWLHRLAIVAILGIYAHLYFLPFLQSNILFMILLSAYTFLVIAYYLYYAVTKKS